MRYRVDHHTHYSYSEPVVYSDHATHLIPRELSHQSVTSSQVTISPTPGFQENTFDYFGNSVTAFTLNEAHSELKIDLSHTIDINPQPDSLLSTSTAWNLVPSTLQNQPSEEHLHALNFCYPSAYVPYQECLREWGKKLFKNKLPIHELALLLTQKIYDEFTFDSTATTVSTPIEEVFESKRGVCQDFSHLMIACLRNYGLPARYVSGYLETDPPPGQEKVLGADASHAWVSVYCTNLGWIDFDPTNDCIAKDRYITLAWGRDYLDVSLIRGALTGGGNHTIKLAVDVTKIN
ncbi:MAG: transglutaminase family protein [Verrucomicrobiota bacterium]